MARTRLVSAFTENEGQRIMKSTSTPNHWARRTGQWLFSQTEHFWLVIGFIAMLLLMLTSITFNFFLGAAQATDEASQFLLPRAYAGLDVAAAVCFSLLGTVSGHRFRKCVAFSWALFLMALSLWAAFSYTLMQDEINHREATGAADSIAEAQATVQTYQQQIDTWQEKLAGTSKYASRFQQRLDEVQQHKQQAQHTLEKLQQNNYPPALTIHYRVSRLLGGSPTPEQIGTAVRLLFSAAITLTPTLLMLLLAGMAYTRIYLDRTRSGSCLRDAQALSSRAEGSSDILSSSISPSSDTAFSLPASPTPSGTPITGTGRTKPTPSGIPATGTKKHTPPATPTPSGIPHEVGGKDSQTGRGKIPRALSIQGDQRDTGTLGDAANRYDHIRQQVRTGAVKPSIKAIRQAAGCNQIVATRYRNQLLAEGIIRPQGNGYTLSTGIHDAGRRASL